MVAKVRLAVTGKWGGSLSHLRLGLLGRTFKADPDDLPDSPAPAVAALLKQTGADLVRYDPALSGGTDLGSLSVVDDRYQVAKDVEALVVLTDLPDFRSPRPRGTRLSLTYGTSWPGRHSPRGFTCAPLDRRRSI